MIKVIKPALLLLVTVFAIVGGFIFYKYKQSSVPSFNYFYTDCTMYDKSGRVIYKNSFFICDYHSNGSVIAADLSRSLVQFIDKNDNVLWSLNKMAHHSVMFTPDEKKILMITEKNIELNSVLYRADCFESYNLQGALLHQWCMKDHLKELMAIGLTEFKAWDINWVKHTGPPLKYELSHSNSFYEIRKNARGENDPIFKTGNFIINLYGPSRLVLILDENLQKILWHKNLRRFQKNGIDYIVDAHDVQVTESGDILIYNNSMYYRAPLAVPSLLNLLNFNLGILYSYSKAIQGLLNTMNSESGKSLPSSLMIFDPYTDQIKWSYSSTPPDLFSSNQLGSVTELPGKHYLFNNNADNLSEAYEIDSEGKIYWHYLPKNPTAKTARFISIRPLTKPSFLKNRSLME
ncbi:MAG: hypothetical protein ACXVAX_10680 [Pseudobdellovibrio sp.]